MYDFTKIKEGTNVKVGQIVNELKQLNQEADFKLCGNDNVIIHVEEDDSVVNLDTEYLEESYSNFGDYKDIPKITPIIFDDSSTDYFDEEEEEESEDEDIDDEDNEEED